MGENAKKERSNIYMHILDAQSEADNGGSGGGRVVASYIIYITITHQAKRKKVTKINNIITNIYLSDHPSNSFCRFIC